MPDAAHPSNDTGDPRLRDDDPQDGGSKGIVYDLDAPGIENLSSPQTAYVRINFVEYAVLDDARNSVPVSDNFPWYSRVACGMDENNPSIVFLVNNPGDNVAGQGSTSLLQ